MEIWGGVNIFRRIFLQKCNHPDMIWVQRCCNISESLLYDGRMCTHRSDLPQDILFMKINGTSLKLNHGRTQSIEYNPILAPFSWGDVNKRAIQVCAAVCHFFPNTYTGTELGTNEPHAAFIIQQLLPKAFTAPSYFKRFPVLTTLHLTRWCLVFGWGSSCVQDTCLRENLHQDFTSCCTT